jgi:hypothetical protein
MSVPNRMAMLHSRPTFLLLHVYISLAVLTPQLNTFLSRSIENAAQASFFQLHNRLYKKTAGVKGSQTGSKQHIPQEYSLYESLNTGMDLQMSLHDRVREETVY